jgi:hypothetical protein
VKEFFVFRYPPGGREIVSRKETMAELTVSRDGGFSKTALCREEKIILRFFEEGSRQLKLF